MGLKHYPVLLPPFLSIIVILSLGSSYSYSSSEASATQSGFDSALCMNLVRRGAKDFAIVHRRLAPDMETLYAAGYVPVFLHPNSNIAYETAHAETGGGMGLTARVHSGGYPVYNHDIQMAPQDSEIEVPPAERYEEAGEEWVLVPNERGDGLVGTGEERPKRRYLWRGAKWLDEGYSLQEVDAALRIDRARLFMTVGIHRYSHLTGELPQELPGDLEDGLRMSLNKPAWSGIQRVESIEAVGDAPGNFYFGPSDHPDSPYMQIVFNLGPETRRGYFGQGDNGVWGFFGMLQW